MNAAAAFYNQSIIERGEQCPVASAGDIFKPGSLGHCSNVMMLAMSLIKSLFGCAFCVMSQQICARCNIPIFWAKQISARDRVPGKAADTAVTLHADTDACMTTPDLDPWVEMGNSLWRRHGVIAGVCMYVCVYWLTLGGRYHENLTAL